MILGYLLNLLKEAVAAEDYEKQSKVAEQLIPFERTGKITNQDIAEIILSV